MNTVEIIKARAMMCKHLRCGECPLNFFPDCDTFCMLQPEKAVELIEKWYSENLRKWESEHNGNNR